MECVKLLRRNYCEYVSVFWVLSFENKILMGLFFFNFFSICPCWVDWQFSVSYIPKYWYSEHTDKTGKIEIFYFFFRCSWHSLHYPFFLFPGAPFFVVVVVFFPQNSCLMIPTENQLLLWSIMEEEWLLNSLITGLYTDCQSLQDKVTSRG